MQHTNSLRVIQAQYTRRSSVEIAHDELGDFRVNNLTDVRWHARQRGVSTGGRPILQILGGREAKAVEVVVPGEYLENEKSEGMVIFVEGKSLRSMTVAKLKHQ